MPRLPGSPYGLPGYEWVPSLHNYRNLQTGRMVARGAINNLLIEVTNGGAGRLARLAAGAVRGDFTARQFYELAGRELKHLYNANVALARGGWDRVGLNDFGRNGQLLQEEYKRLQQFAREIAEGKITEAQAEARAKLYADSAYQRYHEIEREMKKEQGKRESRIVTAGDDRVCTSICIPEAAKGWRPIDEVPIGGSLHAGCRCVNDYR